MNRKITTALMLCSGLTMAAQNIDFDMTGRQSSEVTEPNYISWAVGRVASDAKELDNGLRLAISPGDNANGLASNWNKNSVQSGLKLLGDGVYACVLDGTNTVKVTEGATSITLTIYGLSTGQHSLIAYHNNTDKNQVLPPIQVEVNGVVAATNVKYSTNADGFKASDAGRSYVEFDAVYGNTVTIKYTTVPEAGKEYSNTGVMINGLEFDTNPYTIMDEFPENHDYHANADNGLTLSWKGSDVAVSHKLVIGTDSTAVANSTTYDYEGTEPQFAYHNYNPLIKNWWRVDEVEADGTTHKGKVMDFQVRRIAFSGAQGYGKYAIGGRGGEVYHVTSLADDDMPGTLRYGIEQVSGPRTIVFDVSGIITLKSSLVVKDKYVTIAGQTAPGRGILLRGKSFGMQSDGITRFLRLYLGGADDWNSSMGGNENTSDGMGMAGNDYSIMDHCSIAWTIDEGFSSRNAKTMTLQRTMISEALNYAGHNTQYDRQGKHVEHGYAATIGGGEMGSQVGSYHHNLLAHCEGRNWSLSGGLDGAGNYDGHHDVFNNVVYNWGARACDGGTHELNFVNNYYKMGPASTQKYILRHQFEGTGTGTQSAYVSGNIRENLDGSKSSDAENDTYRYELSNGQELNWEPWSKEPFFTSEANVESAEAAFKNVLSDVGCNMPDINNHDARIVSETLNGTTSTVGRYTGKKGLPDCESDAGGYASLDMIEASREEGWDTDLDGIPNWFEKLYGTDPNTPNNNNDTDGDGMTDLEYYLDFVAKPYFRLYNNSVEIDLSKYFAGYKNPEYEVERIYDAKIELDEAKMTVTPLEDAYKFFNIAVTASEDGISLTRYFSFAIDPSIADGINSVKMDDDADANAPLYDLNGRRLNIENPQTGVYIKGNKKVIVR